MTTTRASTLERGSALLLVLVLLVVLLAGGAVALYVQNADTRSARVVRETRDSLYCAEAGLAASRLTLSADMSSWAALLDADATNDPGWYPVRGDIDGDGVDDYEVTIEDNNDEAAPTPNDLNLDVDAQVFIVSKCIKNPEVPREVVELISMQAGGHVYRNQSGQGAGNTGNAN